MSARQATGSHHPAAPRRRALAAGASALGGLVAAGLVPSGQAQAPRPGVAAAGDAGGSELQGQVALVTGAGRGIGRAVAVALARAGAGVAVLDVAEPDAFPFLPYRMASEADLAETVRLVEAQGRRALAVRADVRDSRALQNAVARAEAALGPLSVAVANAGLITRGPLLGTSDERWAAVVGVNLTGTANTFRAVLPGMAARGRGRVVAITSTQGRQGAAANPDYVATKWGIVGLVKAAALEVGPRGVTVNAVAPTAVRSVRWPAGGDALARAEAGMRAAHALDVAVLEPEEVAAAVRFLAGPGARHVSGAVLDVAAGANARYTA